MCSSHTLFDNTTRTPSNTDTLSELWTEIQNRVKKAKESRVSKFHTSVFPESHSGPHASTKNLRAQVVRKEESETPTPSQQSQNDEDTENTNEMMIVCPVEGCSRLYKGKRSLLYHVDNAHFVCRKVVRDVLKNCKTATEINGALKDKKIVVNEASASPTPPSTPGEPPLKKMKKPTTPPGKSVRIRVRFQGRILNKTNAIIDTSKKKEISKRCDFEARALFGLTHPEIVALLPGMAGSEKLSNELLPPMNASSVQKGYISAISSVASRIQGFVYGETMEIARIERQLMREEEKEMQRLMREEERMKYRDMLDAIQAPSTDLVSRLHDEWKFSDSSSRVVADVAQSSSSSDEIVPYFFDSADQVTMLKNIINQHNDEDMLIEVYEFLKNFSCDLDPEISTSAITSEASTHVKSTLKKLNVSTLLKSLTEGKDVFGANSVLPYRTYLCSRVRNTSNTNTNTRTGTIVIWILQPIFADMDKVFFGQRSEEEENMSCT